MTIDEIPCHYFKKAPAPRETRLSSDGHWCFSEHGLRNLPPKSEAVRLNLVADWGRELRLFHVEVVAGLPYLVDRITGSMYRADGSSASGSWMRVEVSK